MCHGEEFGGEIVVKRGHAVGVKVEDVASMSLYDCPVGAGLVAVVQVADEEFGVACLVGGELDEVVSWVDASDDVSGECVVVDDSGDLVGVHDCG